MDDKPILVTGTDVDHDAAARVARHFQDAIERAAAARGNKPDLILCDGTAEGIEALRERVKERIAVVGPLRAPEALRAMRGVERVEVVSPRPEIVAPHLSTESRIEFMTPPRYGKTLAQRTAKIKAQAARLARPVETRNQRKRRRRKARP